MTEEHDPKAERAFFGRRKGHPLRARQAELFDTLLPRLALEPERSRAGRARIVVPVRSTTSASRSDSAAPSICSRRREAHPRTGFIGCEPFVNGMAKALAAIDAKKLANIRLHHGDAVDLLDWLPSGSVARVDLLYPDPWPKRRHWKRRFVNETNIARLARVLRPGGEFRFATDWANYAEWTLWRLAALARIHLDRRARRRLAQAVAGLLPHAL